MSLPPDVGRYFLKSPEVKNWRFSFSPAEKFERVVVIPALAESTLLLKTLASLVENPKGELANTVVVCVINNRQPGISSIEEIDDNAVTLKYLERLSNHGNAPSSCPDPESFDKVKESGMRIAYVDASTPGLELPEKGGVGLARKIGMDLSLTLFDYSDGKDGLIICLDADTLVEENYLSEISRHFENNDDAAAVLNFSHILPEEEPHRTAAVNYELYLRYYELGLRYAGSPYAYQTIGSTMTCRASAYAAVGGMNRKRAGEDFYFLQNVAKYGSIGRITGTTVHPSMRISLRVPFGTGRKMGELAGRDDKSIPFYNPEIFRVLKAVIALLNEADHSGMNGAEALESCRKIDNSLADYFASKNFDEVWDKIRKNSRDGNQFRRNIHVWFDAFQTLKLAHYLRDNGYGTVKMLAALRELFKMKRHDPADITGGPEEFIERMRRQGWANSPSGSDAISPVEPFFIAATAS